MLTVADINYASILKLWLPWNNFSTLKNFAFLKLYPGSTLGFQFLNFDDFVVADRFYTTQKKTNTTT